MVKSSSRKRQPQITVYCTEEEFARWKQACEEEDRKQTAQAHRLIFDWVDGRKRPRGGGSSQEGDRISRPQPDELRDKFSR